MIRIQQKRIRPIIYSNLIHFEFAPSASSRVMNSSRYICTFVSVGFVVTWKPGIPEFSRVFCWSIAFWSSVLIEEKIHHSSSLCTKCQLNFEVKLQ